MNVLSLIGQVFKPATELVDSIHTSEEEKLEKKAVLLDIQSKFLVQALEYEQEQLKAKAEIITAEAKSKNVLTSSWRPVTMYTFLAMLVAYWFGWIDITDRITPDLLNKIFSIMQIGIGGYIGSRGIEKVVPAAVDAFKKREQT